MNKIVEFCSEKEDLIGKKISDMLRDVKDKKQKFGAIAKIEIYWNESELVYDIIAELK